jgi:hypothetical protein
MQFVTAVFPLQLKKKSHDGVASHVFILEFGSVMDNNGTVFSNLWHSLLENVMQNYFEFNTLPYNYRSILKAHPVYKLSK